jgi:hypothetical protein
VTVTYRCYWTGEPVYASREISTGAILPQVKTKYLVGGLGWEEKKRKSYRLFADSEGNCNTCKHLRRIPHKKTKSDFVQGDCASPNPSWDKHPYVNRFSAYGHMIFHPDDWMGMPCYESRWEDDLE